MTKAQKNNCKRTHCTIRIEQDLLDVIRKIGRNECLLLSPFMGRLINSELPIYNSIGGSAYLHDYKKESEHAFHALPSNIYSILKKKADAEGRAVSALVNAMLKAALRKRESAVPSNNNSNSNIAQQ
ncbi:MAG: hypothetical protein HND52_03655 [Ignavibacteriae bacterium]|nr:hypothetical protein [Ignavibacteriota bacterium]NOG97051.1 hypothetical protein [Ignavibacteriota bacterium]